MNTAARLETDSSTPWPQEVFFFFFFFNIFYVEQDFWVDLSQDRYP